MISETAARAEEDDDGDGNSFFLLPSYFSLFMKLRMPEMPPGTLLAALGSYNLLPAIIFLPTRRRCDESASEAALSRRTAPDERRAARHEFMRSFVELHPEIRNHRHWDAIVGGGIASHHAGHMPDLKLVIAKMMSARF